MRVRRYKTEPSLLLEQGREIMKSSDGSLFYFRVMAVNMVLSGHSSSALGCLLKNIIRSVRMLS